MTPAEHTQPRNYPTTPRRAADTGPWPAPIAQEPVHATVRIPGSKSATNRALVIAALADGPSHITGGLEARDTRLMRAALRTLGVRIEDDTSLWKVTPAQCFAVSGTVECGLAGTVMRFIPPLAALNEGSIDFTGDAEALVRPMGPLLDALYDMGATVDGAATTLPFMIGGRADLPGGPVIVDASGSSQFVSGLLLCGARYARGVDVRHRGGALPSRGHVEMTVQMLRAHGVEVQTPEPDRWVVSPGPIRALDQVIEPDLSNAAPFLAAALLTGGSVTILDWPDDTTQPGERILTILEDFGARVQRAENGVRVEGHDIVRGIDVDLADASELTPVVAAIAGVARSTTHIRGVEHIRGHETDRLTALDNELSGLGSHVEQHRDGLTIHPRLLHGGLWHTYADHRMAQAGALLGLLVDELTLDDIGCTSKTMPEFPLLWQDMLNQSDAWSEQHR